MKMNTTTFILKPRESALKLKMNERCQVHSHPHYTLQGSAVAQCMRGSRNFRQGGPGQSDKKALTTFFFFFFFFFFSPQLILQKSNGQFQINLSFLKVPEGSNIFQGGSNFFQRGSNGLFPIEAHITCDFPGGYRIPCTPSGSALAVVECLTRDRGALGLSLTGVTALWSFSKTHLS